MGSGPSKPTLEEQLKENKRMINRAVRELDRERSKLEQEELRITAEIRKQAKSNNIASVKVMAKDLVRTRKYVSKFLAMRSHLQGINLRMQTVKSTEAMARNLKATTAAMSKVNAKLNLPELNAVLQEFQKETEKMGITDDVMGEAIDDVLGDADDIELEETVVSQVLDEIGIDFNEMLAKAPKDGVTLAERGQSKVALGESLGSAKSKPPSAGPPPAGGSADNFIKSMEDRVNALRK